MYEREYDPFTALFFEKEREKSNHRRSRRSIQIKKANTRSSGSLTPAIRKYGKVSLHRYNRRTKVSADAYYKNGSYSFDSMCRNY